MSNLTIEEIKRIKEYLGRKLSEGRLILFTGAGFSVNAKDKQGRNLPLANKLAQEIAHIINLDDPKVTLKDAFHIAKMKKRKEVSKYLKERLNVDINSLNETYKLLINQPWYKAYTLNVDNLFMVAHSKFRFNRKIACISNLTHNQNSRINTPKDLIVMHINGMLEDIPDAVTFSQEQYFERMTLTDSCYSIIASEILQYPFIFFGSKLDEDILWKYIYLRKQKGSIRNLREFRPLSFIVIPELSPSKQALLKEHNIKWVPQTCEEFAKKFLYILESESKIGFIKIQKESTESKIITIPIVSDLINTDAHGSPKQYLLGAEPSWKDIYSNSIIERDKEKEWIQKITKYVEKNKSNPTPVFIFTGTAGDGKTSIAMRFAAHLTNNQHTVGWIDRNSNIPPSDIEKLTENTKNIQVLFIDTPDMYGLKISQIVSRLALRKNLKFIVLVIRSSKLDSLVKTPLFDSSIPIKEFVTYRLTDTGMSLIYGQLLSIKQCVK
ncbi:MAG: SIR2 family protein, partial [Bdellovibrionales bacterium]|nr:SIR2 family protein [Bdellovibrionales bacterium]